MPVVSTENVSVFIPLILRGKVSRSGGVGGVLGVTNHVQKRGKQK